MIPGRRWFMAGMAVLLFALASPLDVYADLLLSVHMIQHMFISMLVPVVFVVVLVGLTYQSVVMTMIRVRRSLARCAWRTSSTLARPARPGAATRPDRA